LNFDDSFSVSSENKEELNPELIFILDDELSWKLLGFPKQSATTTLTAKDVRTLCDFTTCSSYS